MAQEKTEAHVRKLVELAYGQTLQLDNPGTQAHVTLAISYLVQLVNGPVNSEETKSQCEAVIKDIEDAREAKAAKAIRDVLGWILLSAQSGDTLATKADPKVIEALNALQALVQTNW